MRKRGPGAPPSATKDITTSSSMDGRAVRRDSIRQPFPSPPGRNGTGAVHAGTPRSASVCSRSVYKQQQAFKRRKKEHNWRCHQSVPNIVAGSGPICMYKKCPGFKIKKDTVRAHQTKYRCEECSIDKGIEFWLCNTVKGVEGSKKIVNCHQKYHIEMCMETSTSAAESTVDSDLTEE
jgi:hypothetical protein